jgi:rsbT co-antagonist protein RsbR
MHKLTQRNIVLAVLIAYAILCTLLGIVSIGSLALSVVINTAIGALIFAGLAYAYWRGWEPARLTALVATTLLAGFSIDAPIDRMPAEVLIVPLLGLILGNPRWVAGVALLQIALCIVRAYMVGGLGGMGTYGSAGGLLLYGMAVVGMVLSRLMVDTALRTAQENARRAEEARAQAEAQAADLASQAADLAQRNAEQRRLLDLIATLETPAVALADGVLLAPVVGALDSRRAQELTSRLLREVSERRTRHIVLDIAGVAMVDSEVADGLLRLTQALRLLGCAVTVTGISASVAASLTQLGLSLGDVRIARSPKDVLAIAAA